MGQNGGNRDRDTISSVRAHNLVFRSAIFYSLSSLVEILILLLVLSVASTTLAHRLDEYLQATLVTIEPAQIRLQINLTPGVDVAEQVLALIDRNRDGIISTNEAAAYCELLKHDFIVRLDQQKLALKLTASNFPSPSDLRTGWGIIQIEFSIGVDLLAPGIHRLIFENRHLPTSSVYLLNAAQPRSGLVRIITQKRSQTQATGEIEFAIAQLAKQAPTGHSGTTP